MNCNQTHLSTHDKWNRTCILEAFTSTYLHVWGLNIESQVQYYGIHLALLPTSSAKEPGHADISGGNWQSAHCIHTVYCKTSMPFRTCIMLSFSQQPKDAETWIEEWQTDGGERGWMWGSGGGQGACVWGKCTCVMWQEKWEGIRKTLWKQLRPFSPLITHSSHPLCKEPTSHWHNDMIWERIAFYLISNFLFFPAPVFSFIIFTLSLSFALSFALSVFSLFFPMLE